MQMAQSGNIKTGSFTGNGTINTTINIGFEPDVVIVTRDSKTPTAGMQIVAIIKGGVVYNSLYFTASGNFRIGSYANYIYENDDEWGSKQSLDSYLSYATYSNGSISLSNATNGGRCYFINNEKYSWIACKK